LQLNEEAAESQKTEEELEKARAERESHEKACLQQSALVRQLEQELKAHAHSVTVAFTSEVCGFKFLSKGAESRAEDTRNRQLTYGYKCGGLNIRSHFYT